MTQTHIDSNASVWSSERGEFISGKHQKLAEIINDYNPFLFVVYIPANQRDASDTMPFAILDKSPGKPPYIVKHLTEREMDDPQHVLEWIFMGDLTRHRPEDVYARMEARRFAKEVWEEKSRAEEAEDRQELLAQIVRGGRDRKNFFKHDGITFRG